MSCAIMFIVLYIIFHNNCDDHFCVKFFVPKRLAKDN
jgi:hypothetical protein